MAEINPPLHLQARTDHTAVGDRQFVESVFEGRSGVLASGSLAVTQNGTPNMSVNVAAGKAIIAGTENALQGSYHVWNDATKNLVIAASDPTNPRIDLIVAKVEDASYSGVTNAWSLAVVTGTPAASPVAPTAPANSITLAQVSVLAAASSITTARITDTRIFAHRVPSVMAIRNSDWTVADSAGRVAIQYNSSDLWDTDGFHDPSTNNTRITIPAGLGGLYLITASASWDATAAGVRQIVVETSNSGFYGDNVQSGNATALRQLVSDVARLSAGEYLECKAFQNSGGVRTIYGNTAVAGSLRFGVTWLGA